MISGTLIQFCKNQGAGGMLSVLRLNKNNCLVLVTYGPESRVGWSGKYIILDKNLKEYSVILTAHFYGMNQKI